jgi:hypothetical protein
MRRVEIYYFLPVLWFVISACTSPNEGTFKEFRWKLIEPEGTEFNFQEMKSMIE